MIIAAVTAGYPRTVFNAGQVENSRLILYTPVTGVLCEIHFPWTNITIFRKYAEETKSIHNTEKRARIIQTLCEAPFLVSENALINLVNDYVQKVLEDEHVMFTAATAIVSTATAKPTATTAGGAQEVIDLSGGELASGAQTNKTTTATTETLAGSNTTTTPAAASTAAIVTTEDAATTSTALAEKPDYRKFVPCEDDPDMDVIVRQWP